MVYDLVFRPRDPDKSAGNVVVVCTDTSTRSVVSSECQAFAKLTTSAARSRLPTPDLASL